MRAEAGIWAVSRLPESNIRRIECPWIHADNLAFIKLTQAEREASPARHKLDLRSFYDSLARRFPRTIGVHRTPELSSYAASPSIFADDAMSPGTREAGAAFPNK